MKFTGNLLRCLAILGLALVYAEGTLKRVHPVELYSSDAQHPLARVIGWLPEDLSDMHPACGMPQIHGQRSNKIRVLALGDSIVTCHRVPKGLAKSVTVQLQEALGPDYDVRNLSSGGWGTDQAYLAYQAIGSKYRPNHVVYYFNAVTDFANSRAKTALHSARAKPWFEIGDKLILHPPEWEHQTHPLWKPLVKFEVGRRFYSLLHPSPEDLGYSERDAFETPVSAELAQGMKLTEQLILRLKEAVEDSGAHFTLVYSPSGMAPICGNRTRKSYEDYCVGYDEPPVVLECDDRRVTLDLHQPLRWAKAIAKKHEIHLVDPTPPLHQFKEYRQLTDDCLHMNPLGARMLARSVRQGLISNRKEPRRALH